MLCCSPRPEQLSNVEAASYRTGGIILVGRWEAEPCHYAAAKILRHRATEPSNFATICVQHAW